MRHTHTHTLTLEEKRRGKELWNCTHGKKNTLDQEKRVASQTKKYEY